MATTQTTNNGDKKMKNTLQHIITRKNSKTVTTKFERLNKEMIEIKCGDETIIVPFAALQHVVAQSATLGYSDGQVA
jgi:hypothetical protein